MEDHCPTHIAGRQDLIEPHSSHERDDTLQSIATAALCYSHDLLSVRVELPVPLKVQVVQGVTGAHSPSARINTLCNVTSIALCYIMYLLEKWVQGQQQFRALGRGARARMSEPAAGRQRASPLRPAAAAPRT